MFSKPSFPLAPVLAALCLWLGACDRGDSITPGSNSGPSTASTQSGGGTSLQGKTIGFSQIGAESAWRTAETRSIESEAQKRGVNLKLVDAQQKQENQIRTLRNFITQRVDAIILAPVRETGWEPVLAEVKRAKIPVILVDRGIAAPEDLYATLIASDFVAEGRMAGEWLVKETGGKAVVAELQGTTGAAPANDRAKGFREALAGQAGMQIPSELSQTGDFTTAKGKEVMEAFLKSPRGKDIQVVYAHNDDMALGAIQAIEEAGKKPGQDIKIVCIDAGKAALEQLAAGKINCAVECSPRLGPQAFDAVAAVLGGETLPKKQVVKDRLFDKNNVKDVLARGDYWE